MRRVLDLCAIAMNRGIARYSSFLSDREQTLALAALNREGCEEYSFDGGYPFAERRVLCIEPAGACGFSPIACVRMECLHVQDIPGHKDYLGAVLGLGLDRSSIGDIVLDPNAPGTAAALFTPSGFMTRSRCRSRSGSGRAPRFPPFGRMPFWQRCCGAAAVRRQTLCAAAD